MEYPLVAIWMVTYNHEKYIAQAIESVVSQKANFKFRLFIGEDCSKDNTRAICQQYVDRYPEIVTLIPTTKNDIVQNCVNIFDACKKSGARYVAVLEGDDYWTDNYKLQKQVDFLDAHPDFSICYTDVDIIDDMAGKIDIMQTVFEKDVVTVEDVILADRVFIHSATLMYRNILPNPMPQFYLEGMSGDIVTHLLLLDKGKGKLLTNKTAAYRHHSGGITKSDEHKQKSMIKQFLLYEAANKYFQFRYDSAFRKQLFNLARTILIYGARGKEGSERRQHGLKYFKWYFRYQPSVNMKEILYYLALFFAPQLLKVKSKK